MLKELYLRVQDEKGHQATFDLLKGESIENLNAFVKYIFENEHRVTEEAKTEISDYGDIAKAIIYKSLEGLQVNATQEEIKNAILSSDFLTSIYTDAKQRQNAERQAQVEKVADALAKKIHARGGNPQAAFEEIARNNPGWFMQIIEFFARCLYISTEYNAMRSFTRETSAMQQMSVSEERRKHLVKKRPFDQSADPRQIGDSAHTIGKVKKAVKGDAAPGHQKHTQEWFEKKEVHRSDIAFGARSPIKDSHIREVFTGAMMRFLLGDANSPKTRLRVNSRGRTSVISQRVGFDPTDKHYKATRTLLGYLAGDDNITAAALEQNPFTSIKIQTDLIGLLRDPGFAGEFCRLHGLSMALGNIDFHLRNIVLVENNTKEGPFKYDMVPIDFGLSVVDSSKDPLRELVEQCGGYMKPAMLNLADVARFNTELAQLESAKACYRKHGVTPGAFVFGQQAVAKVHKCSKEIFALPEVRELCEKYKAQYQPAGIENVGLFNKEAESTCPNKSQSVLGLVDKDVKQQALKAVVEDVESRRDEFLGKIEDTCSALGIGPRETREVMKVIEGNIAYLKELAGMDVAQGRGL